MVISDTEPSAHTANPTPELELGIPWLLGPPAVLTHSPRLHSAENAERSPNFSPKASPVAGRAARHPPAGGGQGAERGGRARQSRIETGRAAWSWGRLGGAAAPDTPGRELSEKGGSGAGCRLLPAACQSRSPPLVSAPPASPAGCRGCGSCSPRGRRQRVLPLLLPPSPRPHGFVRQRHGRGARLGADPSEAGGTGVHLPGAVPGSGRRAEPRLGDGGPPVLPVPVGVLPQARKLGELALRVHAAQR